MTKKIAYIVSNPGTNDSRVLKMALSSVNKGYEVHLFGVLRPGYESYEEIGNLIVHRLVWRPIDILVSSYFLMGFIERVNRRFSRFLAKKLLPYLKYSLFSKVFADQVIAVRPDIIHAHDLICLKTACDAARNCGASYIYDAHELETHRNPPLPFIQKKLVTHFEKKFSRDAAHIITVGRYVGAELQKVLPKKSIECVYNSPMREQSRYNLRDDLKVDANRKIIIYVGKIAIGRGIEDIIGILPSLSPETMFVTVGPADVKQKNHLEKLAQKMKISHRFRVLPPVPHDHVVDYISGADLGIISVQPVTLSYRYCMPNKLFELSFANVPILSNDLDEIREFIGENGNGEVIDINDTHVLAYSISKLLKKKKDYVMSAERYGLLMDKYSWETQAKKIHNIYSMVLSKHVQ